MRFHIGVNFLGGGAAAVEVDDEDEEGAGFAVFVEFAVVVVTDEELVGTSFALGVFLFQEFVGELSLVGLLDSEPGCDWNRGGLVRRLGGTDEVLEEEA